MEVILYGRYIVPSGHKVFPVRNLEALIVPILEVKMYGMYATICWRRAVCPFYGGCPLLGGSVTEVPLY